MFESYICSSDIIENNYMHRYRLAYVNVLIFIFFWIPVMNDCFSLASQTAYWKHGRKLEVIDLMVIDFRRQHECCLFPLVFMNLKLGSTTTVMITIISSINFTSISRKSLNRLSIFVEAFVFEFEVLSTPPNRF